LNLNEVILAQGSPIDEAATAEVCVPASHRADLPSFHGASMALPERFLLRPLAVSLSLALALLFALPAALAQSADSAAAEAAAAQRVIVTGRSATMAPTVAGFDGARPGETPLQANVIGREQLDEAGITQLSDIGLLDAGVSDAYNAPGYWAGFNMRGFALDNRFNFRRDGLPINAETLIPIDNKDAIEILKGASGIQAGTSAPGGLVNLVVKRPKRNGSANDAVVTLGWSERTSLLAAADINRRFGTGDAGGVRLNVAAERLDPLVRDAQGHRYLAALAGEWRMPGGGLLEAEVETSHQSQPSVPAFSLLGNSLPDASTIDPRINLNNQAWSLPVIFDATTASLRWQQPIAADWRVVAHGVIQRLRTDDRLAFPFGCGRENVYDRYCSDGRYDVYAFRSDDERHNTDAIDLSLIGRINTGSMQHKLTAGVLHHRYNARLQPRVNDGIPLGEGAIDGQTPVPAPTPDLGTVPNTDRTERSTEVYLRDHAEFGAAGLWVGLRHSRLERESVRTNGDEPVAYRQSFTTPWMALSYRIASGQVVYASWGQGVESFVTPNRPGYTQPGAPLPAQKSRQIELGIKGNGLTAGSTQAPWSVAVFDIARPTVTDDGQAFFTDGRQRHRGVEGSLAWRGDAWSIAASAMVLRARREGAADASANDLEPPNVPSRSLRLQMGYDPAALPGLSLLGTIVHEGDRAVLPDDSVRIPSWTRLDLAARYTVRSGGGNTRITLRAGIDNVTNERAWRESPFQYGHAYLYPLAPRTGSLTAQVAF
jgi:iron complex outermembrane recepter protein